MQPRRNPNSPLTIGRLAVGLALVGLATAASADDWPTFRHDAGRTGVTSETIATPLVEAWAFESRFAPQPAWGDPKPEAVEGYLELRRVHFDDVYQPVAAGGGVYFGSSADNKVYCLDGATGQVRWTKLTGGPIRLAPSIVDGRVYLGSDDGFAYCLNAADGAEVWKFQAAPNDQRVLGSGRMISLYPLRAGVLVDDGVAYLASGVFPAEGVFLYAVDAASGKEIWRNDTLGEEPQSRISPQGYLLASQSTLYAPMARVSPAAFDRKSGALKYTTYYGKAVGGTYALLAGKHIYTGTGEMIAYNADTRDRFAAFAGKRLVVHGEMAYVATANQLSAFNRTAFAAASRKVGAVESRLTALKTQAGAEPNDAQKAALAELAKELAVAREELNAAILWKAPTTCSESLILAGDVLFAGGSDEVIAVATESGKTLWTGRVDGVAKGLAVSDGRLLASTDKGVIHAFASEGTTQHGRTAQSINADPFAGLPHTDVFPKLATDILAETGIKRGYALVVGLETGQLAAELAMQSELMVYAVDPIPEKVAAVRQRLDDAGLLGGRVCVECWPLDEIPYSDYFANLIVSETTYITGQPLRSGNRVNGFRMLKPMGGVAIDREHVTETDSLPEGRHAMQLGDGSFEYVTGRGWIKIERGALPGAGTWTHLYNNPGNNARGDDQVVKAPLGVLWFGRPGPGDMVNRHRRAASPLSMDGRMIVQGENVLMAYDAYNGLKLWRRETPGAIRQNASHDGSNLALSSQGFFVALGDHCIRLDPATGETIATYKIPAVEGEEVARGTRWGYIATVDETLYGSRAASGPYSDMMFALDVASGETRWTHPGSRMGHNSIAIGDGVMYLLDARVATAEREQALAESRQQIADLPESERAAAQQALAKADVRVLVALDAASGEIRYRRPLNVTDCGVANLSLIYANNTLLVFGVYLDGHYWKQFFGGEFDSRRVTALSADNGRFLWSRQVGYRVRPLVIGDTLHTEPWAFDLRTGEQKTRVNPFTGAEEPWQFARPGHHCGLPIGTDNALFFRSYNLGYYDLLRDNGTRHFGGQRPGCWINFIPAGGLLMMPEASAGCMCPFPNMCSVVFKPTEEDKGYTYYSATGPITPARRLAVNFGASGDRSDEAGALWLGYPRPSGSLVLTMSLPVKFYPGGKYEKRDSNHVAIQGTDTPWLFATSARGLRAVEIPLLGAADGTALYSLRLAFSDPDNAEAGKRVFDVMLQGKVVLEDFDIAAEAGGKDRAVVKQFDGVEVTENLVVELVSKSADASPSAATILQGVEAVQEQVVSLGLAVPEFLLNDTESSAQGQLELANIRQDDFEGTLQVDAPEGFEVTLQRTDVSLAAGGRTQIPVTVSVAKGVQPGVYNVPLRLVREYADSAVEVQRTLRIEHLGSVGRLVVPVAEDAEVHHINPDSNRGTATKVIVDGGNSTLGDEHHALVYLKFRFDLPGKPLGVRLRISNAGNPTGNAGHVCLVEGDWSETTITYNARPASGAELAKLGRVVEHQLVECDLDVDLTGKAELSVVLEPTGCDGVDYLTREGGRPAELVIEYEAAP